MAADRDPPDGPRKVRTDETGRSVWDDTIKTATFELVSTQRLKQLLAEDRPRSDIEQLASGDDDGYLARDTATGMFKMIDDDELQSLLDSQRGRLPPVAPKAPGAPTAPGASKASRPADRDSRDSTDFELVSTQRLRKLLDIPEDRARPKAAAPKPVKDEGGGFDPYNSG